jgi:hypothetical protein
MRVDTCELPRLLAQCYAAASAPATRSGEEFHLEVQGTPTGLIYREEGPEDTLYVFFDLGYHAKRDLHRKLLELNASIQPPANGYYAIDPVLSSVIYRVNVPLANVADGAALHRALCALARTAKHGLED